MNAADGITVITLTRRRPLLVQRAIRSVRAQRTAHPVHHVVLVDDCPDTLATLRGLPDLGARVSYQPRAEDEVSGPSRSSRLRNLGVRAATDPWIAFLDDDNEWTPDHLDSLVDCAQRRGVRVAYSDVSLHNQDGSDYLAPRWPWAHTVAEAEREYADYVAKGVCAPGSNVLRDSPGACGVAADTSAWLLARELLLEIPFAERFTAQDANELQGEDDKLYQALVRRREPMACTGRTTLRYYLGGYSNNPDGKTDETFCWASE
jgi:glycosyltransferase involved in cell wall biosynthesis